MQPFSSHTGIAAPLLVDDMNTDQIAPFLPSRSLKDNYQVMLFNRARFREDGSEIAGFRAQQAAIPRRRHFGDRQ